MTQMEEGSGELIEVLPEIKSFNFVTVIKVTFLILSFVKDCNKASPSDRAVISRPYPVCKTETTLGSYSGLITRFPCALCNKTVNYRNVFSPGVKVTEICSKEACAPEGKLTTAATVTYAPSGEK
jgi:hypothetical protein